MQVVLKLFLSCPPLETEKILRSLMCKSAAFLSTSNTRESSNKKEQSWIYWNKIFKFMNCFFSCMFLICFCCTSEICELNAAQTVRDFRHKETQDSPTILTLNLRARHASSSFGFDWHVCLMSSTIFSPILHHQKSVHVVLHMSFHFLNISSKLDILATIGPIVSLSFPKIRFADIFFIAIHCSK